MNTHHSPISNMPPVIVSQAYHDRNARQARSDYLAAVIAASGRAIREALLASMSRFRAHADNELTERMYMNVP